MSWNGTAWASKQTAGSPVNKCVLMMIADATSHDNPILVIKIDTLSQRCEANETTIRRALSALEGKRIIARIDRFQDNVQRACGYVLMVPDNACRLPWIVAEANRLTAFFHSIRVGGAERPATLPNDEEGGRSARGEGVQKVYPEQRGFISSDDCYKSPIVPKISDTDVEALYQAYPKHVGKASALKAISKALKAAPFATLMDAVQEYADAVKATVKADDMQFVPAPGPWFNGGHWEDDRAMWWKGKRRPQHTAPVVAKPFPSNTPKLSDFPDDLRHLFPDLE